MLTVPLTRAEFETLTRDLLMRTRLTTQQVLRQAGLGWDQVDRVLLVGGSTHMPMTGQMLQRAQRQGAGQFAGRQRGGGPRRRHARRHRRRPRRSDDGLPLDAGVRDVARRGRRDQRQLAQPGHRGQAATSERVNDILIPKNTQLPTAASRVYRTVVENQPRVRVKVLQGEAHQADACISIGECWIEGLPPNLPQVLADPGALRRAAATA